MKHLHSTDCTGTGTSVNASGTAASQGRIRFAARNRLRSLHQSEAGFLQGLFGLLAIIVIAVILFNFIVLIIEVDDIVTMLSTGFSESSIGLSYFALASIVVGIAEIIPGFHQAFRDMPRLYSLTTITLMDIFVLAIPELILTRGFEVMGTARHVMTIVGAVLAFLALRALMCWWLWRHPLTAGFARRGEGGDGDE